VSCLGTRGTLSSFFPAEPVTIALPFLLPKVAVTKDSSSIPLEEKGVRKAAGEQGSRERIDQ